MRKKPTSRHGQRAEGKTQTSISLKEDLLEKAKELAKQDGRSFSNWLERVLDEKLNPDPSSESIEKREKK